VTVDAKGNYTINNEPVSFRDVAGFAQAMKNAADKGAVAGAPADKSPVVIINADQFAMHQMVINVMEAARIAGFEKLTFAAQTGAAK
jgi:biopolymer transport protein ExbD